MSNFTENELEYLRGQRLARVATADRNGSLHVVPVGFRVSEDAAAIEFGGANLAGSKKWRDLQVNPKIALVIDDLASVDPWAPRGIEVRGRAELHDSSDDESFGARGWVRIVPERVTSWGIEGHAFSRAGRRRTRSIGGA